MLIELHIIENQSPANLNRDDLGAPKTCVFGGVTRARISSQCLKRSIRRSDVFQKALEKDGGIRTRFMIRELARRASQSDDPPEKTIHLVAEAFKVGGLGGDPKKGNVTKILLFLPETALAAMALLVAEAQSKNLSAKELSAAFAEHVNKAGVPDIALSGRMTEFTAEGAFKGLDFHVEAALSAAHAISTHEVVNEVDYWTAADDLPSGAAAAMIEEAVFASACFYKYFVIDWDQLLSNLGGDQDLAGLTLRQFMLAAATSSPSGKQHAFAAFGRPEGVLVEVKADRCIPTSYANAFADPVPPKSPRGLIGESIARLGQYVQETAIGFGIPTERFWFSPAGRHRLSWVKCGEKGADKEMPVVNDTRAYGSLEEMVNAVVSTVEKASPRGSES